MPALLAWLSGKAAQPHTAGKVAPEIPVSKHPSEIGQLYQ